MKRTNKQNCLNLKYSKQMIEKPLNKKNILINKTILIYSLYIDLLKKK